MKLLAICLSVALLGAGTNTALAQRPGGGGGGGCRSGAMNSMGPREGTGNFVSQIELARQYMMRVQQQEFARSYFQQVHETAAKEEQRIADEKEAKRQEKIAAIKERRAAELAKREAAKARNLARRSSTSREVASNK
jgi:hypothetical protein